MSKDVQRLSADVDRIIADHGRLDSLSTDRSDAKLLQLAQRLTTTDLSGESVGREALRRRLLNQPLRRKSMFSLSRSARLRLLPFALGVLALAFLLTPAGRAMAQSVLIRYGIVELTREPTSIENLIMFGDKAPIDPAAPTAVPPVLSSEQVFVPGYLPQGYVAEPGYGGMRYVAETDEGKDYLRIYTRDPQLGPLAIGEQGSITVMQVRGADAVYVEAAPLYVKDLGRPMLQHELQAAPVNLLLWEEDGVVVVVESGRLGQAELLRIAESLTR